MKGAYLGPEFIAEEIEEFLKSVGAPYRATRRGERCSTRGAALLADEKIVGWFDGRMEFGPRALGARSILGDPRSPRMQARHEHQDQVPRRVPAVRAVRCCASACRDYFELDGDSPYMLLVAPVRKERRIPLTAEQHKLWGIDKLNVPRSDIPAVTHIDYSARIQTVTRETNRALLRPDQGVRTADRLRRARQHVVQRARRADRLHAGGRVPVLHADEHRLPRCSGRSCSTSERSRSGRRRGMAGGIPARLTAASGPAVWLTVGGAFLVFAVAGVVARGIRAASTVLGVLGGGPGHCPAWLIPTHLGPVERAWMELAHLISKVTTPIVMGVDVSRGAHARSRTLRRLAVAATRWCTREADSELLEARPAGRHADPPACARQF